MNAQNTIYNVKSSAKNRIVYLDVAKGLAMLLVIYAHCMYYTGFRSIIGFIYTFHMPVFFLISGYFLSANKSFLHNLKEKAKTLLIPYIVTVLIGSLLLLSRSYEVSLTNLISYTYASSTPIESLGINNIFYIWFLLALFYATVLGSLFIKMEKMKAIFILFTLSSLCFVLYQVCNFKTIPLFLLQGVFATIYVYIGFLCKSYNILSSFSFYRVAFACILYLVSVDIFQVYSIYYILLPKYLSSFIASLAGVYLFIASCKVISKIPYLSTYLRIMGVHSLIVLLVHQINDFYLPAVIVNNFMKLLSFLHCPYAVKNIILNVVFCSIAAYLWELKKHISDRRKLA